MDDKSIQKISKDFSNTFKNVEINGWDNNNKSNDAINNEICTSSFYEKITANDFTTAYESSYGSNGKYIFGVTEPISWGKASDDDLRLTKQMISLLKENDLFETEQGIRRRELLLLELNRLLQEWIYELAVEQGMSDDEARYSNGLILTFGSHRLGVICPKSDIDTICITPKIVTNELFFTFFVSKLQQDSKITNLQSIPDAYTPIIRLCYDGIDVDMVFASMPLQSIPNNLILLDDEILLKNINEKTARCINGCRVADYINNLVPNKHTFKISLRFIRLWAKNRGIYSNVLGYLGGISWALLSARICQLYPNAPPNIIISRFFKIYERWDWKSPVVLCEIKTYNHNPNLASLKPWSPKFNPQDRQHLMPIITPAFPSMNSTHNVIPATMRVLINEFKRANDIVKHIDSGKCTWKNLAEPKNFFEGHKHFLQVQLMASSDSINRKWLGWVESKLRFLIKKLEMTPNIHAYPWPYFYDYKDGEWEATSAIFIAILFSSNRNAMNYGALDTFDLRPAISEFLEIINAWPVCDKLVNMSKNNERYENKFSCEKLSEIFKSYLRSKSSYGNQIHLKVKYLKRCQLPPYVYGSQSTTCKSQVIESENSSKSEFGKGSFNSDSCNEGVKLYQKRGNESMNKCYDPIMESNTIGKPFLASDSSLDSELPIKSCSNDSDQKVDYKRIRISSTVDENNSTQNISIDSLKIPIRFLDDD